MYYILIYTRRHTLDIDGFCIVVLKNQKSKTLNIEATEKHSVVALRSTLNIFFSYVSFDLIAVKMKEFRIILQLGNFFQDHRREARIFITKRFNTIADLEEHITEVFSINNFYLTCQNHLLPCTEDIRVLQEDEAIWYVII